MGTTINQLKALLSPGTALVHLSETPSTNNYLIDNITDNQLPCLVVGEHQSQGKGRRQNTWASQKGDSLTFSIGLHCQEKYINPVWSLVFALTACKELSKLSTHLLSFTI